MLAVAAVVLLAALLAFGADALNLVDVLGTEQQRRALNSVPRAASRVLGSHGLSEGVRVAFAVAFGIVAVGCCCGSAAEPTGSRPRAGRRWRCCCPPPGCCRGTASG